MRSCNDCRVLLWLMAFAVLGACRKPYLPPAIKASNHYLVIDGFVNTASNAVTSITISRTRNLVDSVSNIPELHAHATIQSSNGGSFPLQDIAGNGIYTSTPLNLDPSGKYQVAVTTSDGSKYLSDYTIVQTAPPIDSITWRLAYDTLQNTQVLTVYANAHDPSNNTRYYRWDYTETWEYHSFYQSAWGLQGDTLVFPVDSTTSTATCWISAHSTNIILASSAALAQDIISNAPVAQFNKDDSRLDVRYSMLLREYPLTADAYNYWLLLQKNSESLGGLFDLQPSQLDGNIHCVNNPSEPVLGYITASSEQEKRIFIDNHTQLPGWQSNPSNSCTITGIPQDPNNTLRFHPPDTTYAPYYFVTGGIYISKKPCLDCRRDGGQNVKPSFWQ